MSIENSWKRMEPEGDDDFFGMLNEKTILHLKTQNPLQKIKKNLLINIIWGTIVALLYIVILIIFPILPVRIIIAIVLAFTLWALITAWQQYKKITPSASSANTLLAELRRHHSSIIEWMQTQLKVSLFIYPISAAAGFMIGGVVGSGKPVEAFMNKPVTWIILLIAVIILTPLCHWMAKRMFRYSFGKLLNELANKITELEED